jgi:Tol biopolymer transport system component
MACLTAPSGCIRRNGATAVVAAIVAAAVLCLSAAPAHAAFPGANGKFVVASGPDLYTFDPDGTKLTNITNSGGALQPRFPSWSADGRRIAFASDTPDEGFFEDIFVINADGSGLTNLTNSPAAFDFEPSWSPDGTKIAFARNLSDAGWDIYSINVDGTGLTNITQAEGRYFFNDLPAWSPDGTQIAFVTEREVDNWAPSTWLVNAAGGGEFDLAPGLIEPDWAPDAGKLVLAALSEGPSLFTINRDGTGLAQVPGLSGGARWPVWSPDGQKIAFLSPGGLSTIDVDGTDPSGPLPVAGLFDWAPVPPNRPPDCSDVRADPSTLLPANGRLRLVTLTGASDPDGDAASITITAVTQDERLTGPGDRTSPDAVPGDSPDQVRLRAESSRRGDGRVYRIDFELSDGQDSCTGQVTVQVPRRRGTTAVDSAPPSYDSFGS